MIIGIYLYRHEKQMYQRYIKLKEKEKILQKTISDLTEEIYISKYGKKIHNKNEFNIKDNSNFSQSKGEKDNRLQIIEKEGGTSFLKIQGTKGTTEIGSSSQHVGNTFITTRTTEISFRKRKLDNNQQ